MDVYIWQCSIASHGCLLYLPPPQKQSAEGVGLDATKALAPPRPHSLLLGTCLQRRGYDVATRSDFSECWIRS